MLNRVETRYDFLSLPLITLSYITLSSLPDVETPVTFLNKEGAHIVTGYEAESVRLMGEVSKERAVVSWLHDWSPVVVGERFKTSVDGAQRFLTIERLRRSDAGDYTCDVGSDQMHFTLLVKGKNKPCTCLYPLHFTLLVKGNSDELLK